MRISDWSSDVCSSDLRPSRPRACVRLPRNKRTVMPKRVLTGTVVSNKGDKTVVVKVERKVKHPLYGKIIRRSKKYHAHDEDNSIKAGETVRIEETKPYSKLKTWKVLDKVETSIKPKAAPVATPASVEVEA